MSNTYKSKNLNKKLIPSGIVSLALLKKVSLIIVTLVLLGLGNSYGQFLTRTGTLTSFTACSGSNSSEQIFTISGNELLNDIIITSPRGYEISLTSGNEFKSRLVLSPQNGDVANTNIYVRLASNAVNGVSGYIKCASVGAISKSVYTGVANVLTKPLSGTILGDTSICAATSTRLTFVSLQTTTPIGIAFSLRRLVESYNGYLIKVRRSSDGAEQNIGYNSQGDLDEIALKYFVGSGDGFVTIWYDQSGKEKHMVQPNQGLQPKIVSSGNLKYINNRPTIDFYENKGLFFSQSSSLATASAVVKSEYERFQRYHAFLDASNRIGGLFQEGGTDFHGNQYPLKLWRNGVSLNSNGSLAPINEPMVVSINTVRTAANNLSIGNYDTGGGGGAVLQSEVIGFESVLSDEDRKIVEINQGIYYGISINGDVVSAKGGIWSSSNESVAIVNQEGVVTGIAAGKSNISYKVNNGSCEAISTKEITVNTGTPISPITGLQTVCVNRTITLSNSTSGGTWFSSDTTIAVVNPTSGVVSGKLAGDVMIFYTKSSADICASVASYKVKVINIGPIKADGVGTTVEVLVVAGGGGGGMDMGGGGGGGGVIYKDKLDINAVSGKINVVVGKGGRGAPKAGDLGQPSGHPYTVGAENGENSSFGTLIAIGGGKGGTSKVSYSLPSGNGGSGGGATGYDSTPGQGGAKGIVGQGFDGGNAGGSYYSGGGGGAGGAGGSGPSSPNGGPGIQFPSISPFYWAGGGGGSGYSANGGNGGIGGGGGGAVGNTTGGAGLNNGLPGGGGPTGAWANTPGGHGGENTGGGGGGGAHFNGNNYGGNGGSGIVIVKYAGSPIATGGTITQANGFTTHTFTQVGSNEFMLLSGGSGGTCIGGTKLLKNDLPGGVWSSSNTAVATIDANGLVTSKSIGNTIITYTYTEPTSGCILTTDIKFYVTATPSAPAISGTLSACPGGTTDLIASSTSSDVGFKWYDAAVGGNLLYSGTNFTTPKLIANTTFYVESVNQYGCESSSRTPVTVNLTTPYVTITPSDYFTKGICKGDSITLTASGADSYVWGMINATPLDYVNSSSKMAVGLRKLKSSYTGSAVRLRRSSDNSEMDFGFLNTDLDTAAIKSWLSNSDGYCVKLYDQSGNDNHMITRSTSEQPLYIAKGINKMPTLRFNTSQSIRNDNNFGTPFTVIYTARQIGGTNGRVLQGNNNWLLGWWNGRKQAAFFEGWVSSNDGASVTDDKPVVYSATGTGNTSAVYYNSEVFTVNANAGVSGPNGLKINDGESSDAEVSEIFIFNTVLSTKDRELIERSSGSYYGIYGEKSILGSSITVSPKETTQYTLIATYSNGCTSIAKPIVKVNTYPEIDPIEGQNGVTVGQSTQLKNDTPNGVWGTSNVSIATISNSGLVTGVSLGKVDITYTYTSISGCSSIQTKSFTVVKDGVDKFGRINKSLKEFVNSNGKVGSSRGITENGELIFTGNDGRSPGSAASSAMEIKTLFPNSEDGFYWINVPGYGPKQTYCLMDSKYDGGGWMLALKATRGNTFKYSSDYWTTDSVLNVDDLTLDDADAKYDIMNGYQAKDMLALWPDIIPDGSESGSIDDLPSWSWLQKDFYGDTSITLINFFAKVDRLFIGDANEFSGKGDKFSSQSDVRFYGFNYRNNPQNARTRWGFGWNENGGGLYPNGDMGSDDVVGGIGLDGVQQFTEGKYSAGDIIGCCQNSNGINRSARVELYIR